MLGVVTVVVAVGFAAYYFYFRAKGGTVITNRGTQQAGNATTTSATIVPIDNRLQKISDTQAVSPMQNPRGGGIIFAGKSSGIYEMGFDGNNLRKTDFTAQPNLFKVLWGENPSEFVTFYGASGIKQLFYNNSDAKTQSPLPSTLGALSLSKTENKMVYLSLDASQNQNVIAMSDMNGGNAATVLNTRLSDVMLNWIGQNEVAAQTTPSGLVAGSSWLLNISSRKLTSVLSDIYGLTTKWGPQGDRFLFSETSANGRGLSLSVSDKTGTNVKKLDLDTLPEKCVFSADTSNIICAGAESAPDLVWPDDYYKGSYSAQEHIWRVNLSTGNKTSLYEFSPDTRFDATNLVLSPDENTLIFLNEIDGYLYSLKLK